MFSKYSECFRNNYSKNFVIYFQDLDICEIHVRCVIIYRHINLILFLAYLYSLKIKYQV